MTSLPLFPKWFYQLFLVLGAIGIVIIFSHFLLFSLLMCILFVITALVFLLLVKMGVNNAYYIRNIFTIASLIFSLVVLWNNKTTGKDIAQILIKNSKYVYQYINDNDLGDISEYKMVNPKDPESEREWEEIKNATKLIPIASSTLSILFISMFYKRICVREKFSHLK